MLAPDLIDRLRARAGDPARRTDALDPNEENSHFGGAFKTVRVSLGGPAPAGPAPLPPPATADEIAAAEAALGFGLPEDLAQLYSQVADGGFGPGDGLAPLGQAVRRYRDLLADPPGWRGQRWPASLLPVCLTEPGADCYDVETGRIVFWDEESLADGPSDKVWKRSFKPQADSLAAWLEEWLARPTLGEKMRHDMEQVMLDGLRSTLATWRAKTPEERAEYGLPEDGWEEVMFGHLGVDLKNL